MQDQFTAAGQYTTPNARKYMTQLCKHFAHKVPTDITEESGEIRFDIGTAQLRADDAILTVNLMASSDEALDRLRGILDSHLQRFAFREEFAGIDWSAAHSTT